MQEMQAAFTGKVNSLVAARAAEVRLSRNPIVCGCNEVCLTYIDFHEGLDASFASCILMSETRSCLWTSEQNAA